MSSSKQKERYEVLKIKTTPYGDQMPGSFGFKSKSQVYERPNYVENFIQAILNGIDHRKGCVLVVGGDGRYLMRKSVETTIRICAANKVNKLIVGKCGMLSTPAASHLIRKAKATGGILFTACHNRGGPKDDFGIKLNDSNGAPAQENVTDKIHRISINLTEYSIVQDLHCNIDEVNTNSYTINGYEFVVDVIDPIMDYVQLMKDVFDFDSLRQLFKPHSKKKPFSILIDSMHGITGPYVEQIFIKELGANKTSLINTKPLEDFGGLTPNPTLCNSDCLIEALRTGNQDFGAAFDADGDRNAIFGKNALFVLPSDSLAILADHLHCIPYFRITGIKGLARDMPLPPTIDRVAQRSHVPFYEVPTGYAHFASLMDAERISFFGQENCRIGFDYIRETDGIFVTLAWLQVLALEKKSVEEVVTSHWKKYGRCFYNRYDYKGTSYENCEAMMRNLDRKVTDKKFKGTTFVNKTYTVSKADNYSYIDPVNMNVISRNGVRVFFEEDSRIVFRLNTGYSPKGTVRIYVEKYVADENLLFSDPHEVLRPLIDIAHELLEMRTFLGECEPVFMLM